MRSNVKWSTAQGGLGREDGRGTRTGRWSWNTDGKMVVDTDGKMTVGLGREDDSWTRKGMGGKWVWGVKGTGEGFPRKYICQGYTWYP